MIWTITFSIQDAKAQLSRCLLYVDSDDLITEEAASPMEYAAQVALQLDPLIDGAIVGIVAGAGVPLPGGLKSSPLTNSDVEQGLSVVYSTVGGFRFGHTIATWSESFINDDGTATDDTEVTDFFFLLTHPNDNPGSWQVGPVNNRGDEFVDVVSTKETFKASRKNA